MKTLLGTVYNTYHTNTMSNSGQESAIDKRFIAMQTHVKGFDLVGQDYVVLFARIHKREVPYLTMERA